MLSSATTCTSIKKNLSNSAAKTNSEAGNNCSKWKCWMSLCNRFSWSRRTDCAFAPTEPQSQKVIASIAYNSHNHQVTAHVHCPADWCWSQLMCTITPNMASRWPTAQSHLVIMAIWSHFPIAPQWLTAIAVYMLVVIVVDPHDHPTGPDVVHSNPAVLWGVPTNDAINEDSGRCAPKVQGTVDFKSSSWCYCVRVQPIHTSNDIVGCSMSSFQAYHMSMNMLLRVRSPSMSGFSVGIRLMKYQCVWYLNLKHITRTEWEEWTSHPVRRNSCFPHLTPTFIRNIMI